MKREDLQKIEGLSDDQIKSIMDLHQKDVTDWNKRIDDQNATIKTRDKTIAELTTKVKEFDGVDVKKLQEDLRGWETKYNEGLAAKDREFAKQLLFNNYTFSSNMAKKAAMAEFDEKELKFENGKFLGAEDFFNQLKESDPGSFKEAEKGGNGGGKGGSTGLQHGGSTGGDDDPVTKRFLELNPGLKI